MSLADDIEILLLRSIVERKETCKKAAEILAEEVPKLIAAEKKARQDACRAEGHQFENVDPWGSIEVCQKCGVMIG